MYGDIIGGALKFGASYIGGKKRLARESEAKGLFDTAYQGYMTQDISNTFSNMENTMEDLTVNTQAADFAAQQQSQGLSNIMGSMNQAAGGSGIAALAQSLANQQSQNAQQASASIGQQESMNQRLSAQQAGTLQSMERAGEERAMGRETERLGTDLGMQQAELASAQADIRAAQQARAAAIGEFAGGVGGLAQVYGAGGGFGDVIQDGYAALNK